MLGGLHDGGVFDNASSVTLQDEFPWHEVGVDKSTHRIPSTIVPALLQGISNVPPASDSEEDGSCKVDNDSSDSEEVMPRYSTAQKGKWKAQMDSHAIDHGGWIRSPTPDFHLHNIHNVSILVPLDWES